MEYLQNGKKIRKEGIYMRNLKILYADNHIIVVEKPPNVPSQADKTTDEDMRTIIKG